MVLARPWSPASQQWPKDPEGKHRVAAKVCCRLACAGHCCVTPVCLAATAAVGRVMLSGFAPSLLTRLGGRGGV